MWETPSIAEQRVVPAFLRACGAIDAAANLLLLGAVVALAMEILVAGGCAAPGVLIGASVLSGLTEKYFALRVRFDRELFELLVQGKLDLSGLDQGLSGLFGKAAPAAGRGWEPRVRGAMALARRQLAAFAIQGLSLALAAISLAVC